MVEANPWFPCVPIKAFGKQVCWCGRIARQATARVVTRQRAFRIANGHVQCLQ